jgi:structure-specific recognition protein 1
MVGPLSNLLAKVFKVLSGKKVFIPGNFRSDRGAHAVKCALRANEGLLYPLEKSFIFIHKPPVLIRFSDIDSVEFQRFAGAAAGAAGRSFDLAVSLKQAAGDATKEYVFSGIDRAEYKHLYEFLQGKSLRIKNIQEDNSAPQSLLQEIDQQITAEGYDDEESEEDEDYKGGASDEESSSEEDGSESGAEMVPETPEKPKKKKKAAAPAASKPSKSEPSTASKKRAAAREEKENSESEGDEGDEGDSPAKKGRKKRDPNAPKAAKTAYSYFQQSVRQCTC